MTKGAGEYDPPVPGSNIASTQALDTLTGIVDTGPGTAAVEEVVSIMGCPTACIHRGGSLATIVSDQRYALSKRRELLVVETEVVMLALFISFNRESCGAPHFPVE